LVAYTVFPASASAAHALLAVNAANSRLVSFNVFSPVPILVQRHGGFEVKKGTGSLRLCEKSEVQISHQ
jgi:hypothetical protein